MVEKIVGLLMNCLIEKQCIEYDKKDIYDYLGGTRNDKRSEELDALFKKEKSNFRIVIVVDMWITGFDVPALTYMYNDKPLKKHMLIQTISRVNRKYPGKDEIVIFSKKEKAIKRLPTYENISAKNDVFSELKSLFGEKNVKVREKSIEKSQKKR